jgi:uncharacterized membrane protein
MRPRACIRTRGRGELLMSNQTPRMEAWLWIMLSSFIPILLMAVAPATYRTPLIVLAVVPLTIGLGIMFAKHWPK